MSHLKARLLGAALILLSTFLTWHNWRELYGEGRYSMKLAAFGPVGVVGGLFLLLFPQRGGRPETTGDKVIALPVLGVGLAAGLLNWYLMDPGFFGR